MDLVRAPRYAAGDELVPREPVGKSCGRPSPPRDPGDANDVSDRGIDECVQAFLPLEIFSAGLTWKSEDHMVIDEIRVVLPPFSERRHGVDRQIRELLAHDVAHDLGRELAICRRWLVEADRSRHS